MDTLTITDYGVFLGKHSERLVVKKGKETVSEHPLMDLEQVTIATKGVSLSTDLIFECTQRGIVINLLLFSGQPYAQIVSPALTATVRTRREQLLAYYDERGVEVARRFAAGKVRNQINTVKYFAKYRKARAPKKYAELMKRVRGMEELLKEIGDGRWSMADGPDHRTTRPPDHQKENAHPSSPMDQARSTLLNLEGRAAALYWECVQRLLPEGRFAKREHRGAEDDVNALLNYGYGILYSQVWSALTLAGLEPFAGFLHVDRPGKPSLVLDFMEEFRQPAVDRVAIALLNKGFVVEWETPETEAAAEAHQAQSPEAGGRQPGAGGTEAEAGKERTPPRGVPGSVAVLSAATRKALAEKVLARLEDTERYEGKQQQLKHIIQKQARHLATFLRREGEYKPFVVGW